MILGNFLRDNSFMSPTEKEINMAGVERPRCLICKQYYKYDWKNEKMYPNCECDVVKRDKE